MNWIRRYMIRFSVPIWDHGVNPVCCLGKHMPEVHGGMRNFILLPVILIGLKLTGTALPSIVFVTLYMDRTGEGFNDPSLGPKRKNALLGTFGVMSALFNNNYVGEKININASFDSLGGTANSATLGNGRAIASTANFGSSDPDYRADTWYGYALANHLHGSDLDAATAEIQMVFNSDFDGPIVGDSCGFYYGSDENPNCEAGTTWCDVDFITVALHELLHGLDLSSGIKSDGSLSSSTVVPDAPPNNVPEPSSLALLGLGAVHRSLPTSVAARHGHRRCHGPEVFALFMSTGSQG